MAIFETQSLNEQLFFSRQIRDFIKNSRLFHRPNVANIYRKVLLKCKMFWKLPPVIRKMFKSKEQFSR